MSLPERLKELMFPDEFAHILGADPSPAGRGRVLSRDRHWTARPSPAWPRVSAHSGYGRSADAHSPQSCTIQLVHDNDDDFSCSARLNPSRRKRPVPLVGLTAPLIPACMSLTPLRAVATKDGHRPLEARP